MRDILKLYLTRNFVLALLFLAIYIFIGNIPMIPIQNTFYAFISVSVMAFFMTIFARPDENRGLILPGVLRYCIPASIIIAIAGLLIYGITWLLTGDGTILIDYEQIAEQIGFLGDPGVDMSPGQQLLDQLGWGGSRTEEITARTAMVLFVSLIGLLQIFIICPRWKFLSIDGNINRSPVPFAITALVLAAVISMYVWFPWLAVELIGFTLLPDWYYGAIVCFIVLVMAVEIVLLKLNVFRHLIERFEKHYMRRLENEYR